MPLLPLPQAPVTSVRFVALSACGHGPMRAPTRLADLATGHVLPLDNVLSDRTLHVSTSVAWLPAPDVLDTSSLDIGAFAQAQTLFALEVLPPTGLLVVDTHDLRALSQAALAALSHAAAVVRVRR